MTGFSIGLRQQFAARQQAPNAGGLAGAGFALQLGGAITSAIGTYYGALNQKYQFKSQALALEFEQTMAALNAQQAAADAAAIQDAAEFEKSMLGLRYAQERGSRKASAGARGVKIGVGSAAEEQASIAFAEETDRITVSANALREITATRMRAVNLRGQSTMAGVSAANLRTSAGSISPGLAAGTSLIGSAGYLARQAAYDRRRY